MDLERADGAHRLGRDLASVTARPPLLEAPCEYVYARMSAHHRGTTSKRDHCTRRQPDPHEPPDGAGLEGARGRRVVWPDEALYDLTRGDVALFRLDVLPTLDGASSRASTSLRCFTTGVRVLNEPSALLATHDKLLTAARLRAAGVPHPWHIEPGSPVDELPVPASSKPRFGSWGQDVFMCRSPEELVATLGVLESRGGTSTTACSRRASSGRCDGISLVVAGGVVVAAAERRAAPGEWRTNVSLGGQVAPAEVPPEARELAARAVAAVEIDLAGVDLLPTGGRWVVLELNGAVDFDRRYALLGIDPARRSWTRTESVGRRRAMSIPKGAQSCRRPCKENRRVPGTRSSSPATRSETHRGPR